MARSRIKVTPVSDIPQGARVETATEILWEVLAKKLPEGCPAGSWILVERAGFPSYYTREPGPDPNCTSAFDL